MRRTEVVYITDGGLRLAQRLQELFPGARITRFDAGKVPDLWEKDAVLVFIMAAGIVVRTIAPLLKNKKADPAVVVLDEAGRFAVSLVSGHLGGANEMARQIAHFLGGEAVITTASDVNGLPSIDLWARDHDLVIEDWGLLPLIGTRLVNNGALRICSDIILDLPDEFLRVADPRFADIIITSRENIYSDPLTCSAEGQACSTGACRVKGQLYLRPQTLVIGIGCNSGTSQEEIEEAVRRTLEEHNLSFSSIFSLATIDIKTSEPGLKSFGEKFNFPLQAFTPDELNSVRGTARSDMAFKATGAFGVAEPAALLAAGADRLLVHKQKKGNVTVATAERQAGRSPDKDVHGEAASEAHLEEEKLPPKGRIYIVGTGPGSLEYITPAAQEAIRKSEVVVGYGTYLDLIKDILHNKEVLSTGMTQEVDRCRKAVELAFGNRTVAVISGGDPGVYAMAGLVFEILKAEAERMDRGENEKTVHDKTSPTSERTFFSTPLPFVEVIPGISALNASASRLGAPLMHDFACISLSDRLTPWNVIEKRLEAAAAADFVIVLYNPRSKGRAGHLKRARDIIRKHRQTGTVVGIVKGAMREQETVIVTDLDNMCDSDVDMQTTVIVGNSKTFVWNNMMITPRGYDNKFKI